MSKSRESFCSRVAGVLREPRYASPGRGEQRVHVWCTLKVPLVSGTTSSFCPFLEVCSWFSVSSLLNSSASSSSCTLGSYSFGGFSEMAGVGSKPCHLSFRRFVRQQHCWQWCFFRERRSSRIEGKGWVEPLPSCFSWCV